MDMMEKGPSKGGGGKGAVNDLDGCVQRLLMKHRTAKAFPTCICLNLFSQAGVKWDILQIRDAASITGTGKRPIYERMHPRTKGIDQHQWLVTK
jgi:hypothetical protein